MNLNSNKKEIYIIGVDASGLENISNKEKSLISSSKYLAAPTRLFHVIEKWLLENNSLIKASDIFPTDKPKKLIKWLKERKGNSVVISSGDPLWFGIGKTLLDSFPKEALNFFPSPTSLQLACSKIKQPWQDIQWISIHGREPDLLVKKLQERPRNLAILIDPSRGGAEEVKRILIGLKLEEAYEFWICENLGNTEEKVFKLLAGDDIEPLNSLHLVVLKEKDKKARNPELLPIIGIQDGVFYQHKDRPGLMTKSEVRVQILSDLELPKKGVLWDLGAGVGSIGLEAIRLRPNIKLLAIDKRYGCRRLIKKNSTLLGVRPKLIIESDALKSIEGKDIPIDLAFPDRVIIGGGGATRKKLLKAVLNKIKPQGIIVIPLATIEAINEITSILKSQSVTAKISQHQSWRGVPLGTGTRLAPLNPVFLLQIRT